MEHGEIMQQEEERSTGTQQEREEHDAKVMREGGTLSNGQEIYNLEERAQLREEIRRQNAEAQAALEMSGHRRGIHPRVAAIKAELNKNRKNEEKTMATLKKDPIDQTKFYKEKDAIAEGWVISSADDGFQLQRLDDPEEWPGFDPEKAKPFETDEAVFEHVVARAWAGSENHRSALNFLERAAPEEYARTGDLALQMASTRYREAEEARIAEHGAWIWAEMQADPALKARLQDAYAHLDEDMNCQHASRPGLKSFEAHHANAVAREAFLLGYMDTRTPEGALDAARRRMLITVTPHEFYREALAEPEKDLDQPAP